MRIIVHLLLLTAIAFPLRSADLEIQRLSLHQYEDGPVIPADYEYLPGEHAWFTLRVAGYETELVEIPDDLDVRRVALNWSIDAFDPDGLRLEQTKTGRVDERLREQDEDWVPKVVVEFVIPSFAPRGTYRVNVSVTDELDGSEVTGELPFRVRGGDLPEATSLGMRDFRYLAHEDDRFALMPAVYRPGDTLFAKFDIVGYQFGDGNRFQVDYGLTAYGPGDVPMFSQEVAAQETGDSFYPQRWVPAGFSLSLDDDIAAGDYAIGITVNDRETGDSVEIKQPFRIQ